MKQRDSREDGTNSVTYRTAILQTGKNTTGIPVPEEIVEKLASGRRPRVRVTINSYTYRSTMATMNGKYMISLSAEHRQAVGVQGGDEVDVVLALDLEPQSVEIPEDLRSALIDENVFDAFEKLAPSGKKEYVRQVSDAKKQETRERRIAKIIEKLKS